MLRTGGGRSACRIDLSRDLHRTTKRLWPSVDGVQPTRYTLSTSGDRRRLAEYRRFGESSSRSPALSDETLISRTERVPGRSRRVRRSHRISSWSDGLCALLLKAVANCGSQMTGREVEKDGGLLRFARRPIRFTTPWCTGGLAGSLAPTQVRIVPVNIPDVEYDATGPERFSGMG